MTTSERPKVCPICSHDFLGSGWDGIEAHWQAKHADIMPYEDAWPIIRAIDEAGLSEDPECSYRRGYQQGARAAYQASQMATPDNIATWLDVKLTRWRYLERLHDRNVRPPTP